MQASLKALRTFFGNDAPEKDAPAATMSAPHSHGCSRNRRHTFPVLLSDHGHKVKPRLLFLSSFALKKQDPYDESSLHRLLIFFVNNCRIIVK